MADHEKGKRKVLSRGEKKAKLVIGTNDYSIASKRSVEKIYYGPEHEHGNDYEGRSGDLIKPFVHKFKRSSPIINRGYWLRMRAIHATVGHFLNEGSGEGKKVAVVNLGCGYEPLPFRARRYWPELAQNTVFLDVDYPACVESKKGVLLENQGTYGFTPAEAKTHLHHRVVLASDDGYYHAASCDLSKADELEDILRSVLPDKGNCRVLFVAEVSLTYVGTEGANKLIKQLSSFPDARFFLLEQFLPDGKDHPFARTMLAHFDKQTPLQSIHHFPNLADQTRRFRDFGWQHANAVSLWQLWQDRQFVSEPLRRRLDVTEPFDEWEEFALFAQHYFALFASTSGAFEPFPSVAVGAAEGERGDVQVPSVEMRRYQPSSSGCGRNLGAMGRLGDMVVAVGGLSATKHSSFETFTSSPGAQAPLKGPSAVSPLLRCHSMTTVAGNGPDEGDVVLLAGGRTSPSKATGNCWLIRQDGTAATGPLEPARYRHSSTAVTLSGGAHGALVFGGRTSSGEVLSIFSLWTRDGWKELSTVGSISPLFGATIISTSASRGLIFGGLDQNGIGSVDAWQWTISLELDSISVSKVDMTTIPNSHLLSRFGAQPILLSAGDTNSKKWALVGGIGFEHTLSQANEIALIESTPSSAKVWPASAQYRSELRPFLVGVAGCSSLTGAAGLWSGGGAVCFSFGSCYNTGLYEIGLAGSLPSVGTGWQKAGAAQTAGLTYTQLDYRSYFTPLVPTKPVSRVPLPETEDDFWAIVRAGLPVIFSGTDIGECTTRWTDPDYLGQRIGTDREITIHSAASPDLSFQTAATAEKNFNYEKVTVVEFIKRVIAGRPSYFRAISREAPTKTATSLERDFPALASEFSLSNPLKQAIGAHTHSSVLRLSGVVSVWLHYDVLSNILCQAVGQKRVLLFDPLAVPLLGFAAGSTTSPFSAFGSASSGQKAGPTAHEAVLSPGDILFLPPCWPHTTAPVESAASPMSAAVNVFFHDLAGEAYQTGRDVYANRDVAAYERARGAVNRIRKIPPGECTGRQLRDFFLSAFAARMEAAGRLVAESDAERDGAIPRLSGELDGQIRQLAAQLAEAPVGDRMAWFYALRIGMEIEKSRVEG